MQKRKKKLSDLPQEVLQRFFRRRAHRFAIKFSRKIARIKISAAARRDQKELHLTFEMTKNNAIQIEKTNYEASKYFFNLALFYISAARDIQSLKIDALTHPDPWQRKLATRVIVLTMYEWELDKVTGRKLKQYMMEIEIPEPIQQELTAALRETRKSHQRFRYQFKAVRDFAIAHRNEDALSQYRVMRNLDEREVVDLASDYFGASQGFLATLAKVMVIANEPHRLAFQAIQKRN